MAGAANNAASPPRSASRFMKRAGSEALPGDIHGEIGEDQIGPGPLDGAQRLAYGAVLVEGAGLGGELDHRVFAADLVGGERQQRVAPNVAQHVEIGQARL